MIDLVLGFLAAMSGVIWVFWLAFELCEILDTDGDCP